MLPQEFKRNPPMFFFTWHIFTKFKIYCLGKESNDFSIWKINKFNRVFFAAALKQIAFLDLLVCIIQYFSPKSKLEDIYI